MKTFRLNLTLSGIFSFISAITLVSCSNNGGNKPMKESCCNDTICFVTTTKADAEKLFMREDTYIRNLSRFDLESCPGNESNTKEEFMRLSANEAQEWTDNEIELINKSMHAINDTIRKYKYRIPFPKKINLVKTPMTTAGGALGYTRDNWIALNMDKLKQADIRSMQELLMHETFHVLTRSNSDFRKAMYKAINFTINEKELEFPDDMNDMRISNPDVDRFDSYATFIVNGKEQKCAMTIYAGRPYDGGSFFQYLNVGLIALDDELKPMKDNGKTVVYSIDEVDNFKEVVGNNTNYIINPEEIMADNFRIAFLRQKPVNSPEIIRDILDVIENKQ